ncbi:MAG: glycosyltransferase family 2 protein [Acetivibrionales bacterium]
MAVIPAFNEEDTIASTVAAVQGVPQISRILVVDDGSRDQTAERAEKAGAEVLILPSNLGKGGAMNRSVELVDRDVVVFLDADLGETASQASLIIDPILQGKADLCIAAFPAPVKKGGFGLVKGTARRAIRKLSDMEVNSPLSGQRAMNKEVLLALTPFEEAYGVELGMTLKALSLGFRVQEVMTTMKHNETGRDLKGFIHRGQQFLDVIKVIRMMEKEGVL